MSRRLTSTSIALTCVSTLLSLVAACSSPTLTALEVETTDPTVSLSTGGAVAGNRVRGTLFSGGLSRSYEIYTPSGFGTTPLPVLFVFHDEDSDGNDIADITGFDAVAEQEGFIAVYPNATGDRWNDETSRPGIDTAANDVAFVQELLAQVSQIRAVNSDRIFATGFGSGGIFVQLLACELPSVFAGYGAVAGNLPTSLSQTCNVRDPGPVILISGTDDRIQPYSGGNTEGVNYRSMAQTALFWSSANRCIPFAQLRLRPNVDTTDGTRVVARRYVYCAVNQVEFLTVRGGGHTWPGGPDQPFRFGTVSQDFHASETIWSFFEGEPR